MPLADPIKDLKWSNVSGVKLSSLSESDDTFPSLQALLDLYYLFYGFMDYLWSCQLDISNFGPADRKILLVGARATGAAPGIKSIWNSTWEEGRVDNFGMILGQPVHTNDDVETTEFNQHEVNFEGHDKLPTLVGASFTQGKVSSIPTIFSWGGSISPDGFFPSILLLVVIIVVVVVVAVIVVVVVVGEGSSIIKLSFVIIGSLHRIMLCYMIH
ncbi:hypothetical protein Tco_0897132 [Tanacetum coccineum]